MIVKHHIVDNFCPEGCLCCGLMPVVCDETTPVLRCDAVEHVENQTIVVKETKQITLSVLYVVS